MHRPRRGPLLVVGDLNAQKLNSSTTQPLLDDLDALPIETLGVPRSVGDVVAEGNESSVVLRKIFVAVGDGEID